MQGPLPPLTTPFEHRVAELRAEADRHHAVVLHSLLRRPLREHLDRVLASARWVERTSKTDLKTEQMLDDDPTSALLWLLCSDPRLFAFVEAVMGCPPLTRFEGRTYRMLPDAGHHNVWHTDLVRRRQAALSVNLSARPFAGGRLVLRRSSDGHVLFTAPELEFGDAMIFRIAPGLEHRVSEVESGGPKVAHVGFFVAGEPSPLGAERGRSTATAEGSLAP